MRKPHEIQNRKTAIFEKENRKTGPKIGQIGKTENPNAPLSTWSYHLSAALNHLLMQNSLITGLVLASWIARTSFAQSASFSK